MTPSQKILSENRNNDAAIERLSEALDDMAIALSAAQRAEVDAPELMRVDVPKFVEIVEKHPTMIGIPIYYAEWPTRAPDMNKSP